jgi:hypothetical protein
MAVTKPMTPFDVEIGENPELETLDFDMPDDANITKMATEDGEIIIEFGDDLSNDEDGEVVDLPHDTNFADIMENEDLESQTLCRTAQAARSGPAPILQVLTCWG